MRLAIKDFCDATVLGRYNITCPIYCYIIVENIMRDLILLWFATDPHQHCFSRKGVMCMPQENRDSKNIPWAFSPDLPQFLNPEGAAPEKQHKFWVHRKWYTMIWTDLSKVSNCHTNLHIHFILDNLPISPFESSPGLTWRAQTKTIPHQHHTWLYSYTYYMICCLTHEYPHVKAISLCQQLIFVLPDNQFNLWNYYIINMSMTD